MLPLCCAEIITASGPVIDSTALATSTYFASPRASVNTSRCAAWATPTTPIAATTPTATRRHVTDDDRCSSATRDAVPIAISGHVGRRNRKYHHASHGT